MIHSLPERAAEPPAAVHDHLSCEVTRMALTIQDRILRAMRDRLHGMGFVELLPPIIGPVTDPGTRGSKQVDIDYYGSRYKLMTSAILYKQAALLSFDRIFYVAPNVRLEPPETQSTHRHLAEFHQIDVEVAGASRDDAMRLAEDLVTASVRAVLAELPGELEGLGRDVDALTRLLTGPFGRIPHADAVDELRAVGHEQDAGTEIDWPGEEILSGKLDRPVFVVDYPKGSRGFYDRESHSQPGVLRNFDLIAPEGYGELASGGAREHDLARIVTRMRETGENPAKYRWYLDMVRAGIPASAGFGLGAQRLTRYVAGLPAVWQATPFPKLPGRMSP